ncbi:sensor domain-containing diguanylate cyclase [Marinilactibacillus kalidii]|uniref:sensor domain-containing diguanylate cyclase n=1 Tax=Marinilactibacillus kalidii TaxID=2820274 RepID=UPI001ABDDC7A|nr:sensor domain-containing diguanylate cyclase [Marinilactibacillus kalidii]
MISAVAMAMFMSYGIFAEMILSSISILVVMIKIGITKQDLFRVPINLLIFQIVSITSGLFYFAIDPFVPTAFNLRFNLLSLTLYLLFSLFMNRILIYMLEKFWYKIPRTKLFDFELSFSILSIFYATPIAVMLNYLRDNYTFAGILIASLPLVTLSIVFKFYFISKSQNNLLLRINRLAMELTGEYSQQQIIEKYLKSWSEIFSAQTISYYETTKDLQLVKLYEYQKATNSLELIEPTYLLCPSVIEESWLSNKVVCYNSSKEWKLDFEMNYTVESVLVLPLRRGKKIVGFIMMTDSKRNAYKNTDLLPLMTVLHNYFNIALENAYNFEKLQVNSHTDHLTGLTNLRAFESELNQFHTEHVNERFSIIIIDLDHFKNVNDTYGHQAGNELLKQVSILLSTFVYQEERLARYGGEEFIFFLPRKTTSETLALAEEIRGKIEETEFNTHNYLSNRELVQVNMTASIGIASYPDECESIKDLITLADRAMYIGSKQKGRNRVASLYEGESKNLKSNI